MRPKLIMRYLETPVFNWEPRILQNLLTGEQLLEIHPDHQFTFSIDPYQAQQPQKPLRTTSYRHKSLKFPSSILVTLRNRAPHSFGRDPHSSSPSDNHHRTTSYDDRECFHITTRSRTLPTAASTDTLTVRDNKELNSPNTVEAHPIAYDNFPTQTTRPNKDAH